MNEALFKVAVLTMYAFLASHVTWRAASMLNALHPWDQPMFFSRFGILGDAFVKGLAPIAVIAAIASVVWGFLHLPWWAPVPLFFIAGGAFAFMHNLMTKVSPVRYFGLFPGWGALVGAAGLVVTQVMMWFR